MNRTKIPDASEAKAAINPNRLHLLISVICGAVALAYGINFLTAAYSPFVDSFAERHKIEAIERKTGKPYAEWQRDRAIYCSKQEIEPTPSGGDIFAFDQRGLRELEYEACINVVPAEGFVSNAETRTAFIKGTAIPSLVYAGGVAIAAWLIGFLIAKAIPNGSSRLWAWLTSGGRTTETFRMPEFFDVEGVPVSLGNMPGPVPVCAAWDVVPPRPFDPATARRNGAPVSMSEFLPLLSPEALAFIQLTLPNR